MRPQKRRFECRLNGCSHRRQAVATSAATVVAQIGRDQRARGRRARTPTLFGCARLGHRDGKGEYWRARARAMEPNFCNLDRPQTHGAQTTLCCW